MKLLILVEGGAWVGDGVGRGAFWFTGDPCPRVVMRELEGAINYAASLSPQVLHVGGMMLPTTGNTPLTPVWIGEGLHSVLHPGRRN